MFFQDRLKPAVVRMKELIDAGRLGTPVLASGHVKRHRPLEYYGDSKWRGTGARRRRRADEPGDPHCRRPAPSVRPGRARVSARTATRLHSIEVEDTAAAVLEFESGALGIIEAATVFPGYRAALRSPGPKGHSSSIRIDWFEQICGRRSMVSPSDGRHNRERDVAGRVRRHTASPDSEDFIRAIQTNGSPACDGREGRRSVAIVEAIYASARTGQTTDV